MYVCMSRADFLELDNLYGIISPWRQLNLSLSEATDCLDPLGAGPYGIPSVCSGMSTGVMMLALFSQSYCWEFIDELSLSYVGDMIYQQVSLASCLLEYFFPLFHDVPWALSIGLVL